MQRVRLCGDRLEGSIHWLLAAITAGSMTTLHSRFATLITLFALLACSNSQAPTSSLSLGAGYHLRSIGGTPLPFNDGGGGVVDSGHVLRLGGDTIWIDRYTHALPSSEGLPGIH